MILSFFVFLTIAFIPLGMVMIAYHTSKIRAMRKGVAYEGILFEVLLKSQFNSDFYPFYILEKDSDSEDIREKIRTRNKIIIAFWINILLSVFYGLFL